MKNLARHSYILAPLFAATASFSLPSHSLAADSAQLSEIIVTATKTGAQPLLRVPVAIQAITGAQLQQQGSVDFNDYFREVPGLSVFDQGPGDKRYIIRGINAAGASPVGLFLDDVVFTGDNAGDGGGREPDLRLFDINRIEVLKGPQGTTFGSSSLSGVLRYITNEPDLNSFELDPRVALTSQKYSQGVGANGDVAINIPVVPGVFALRIAGYGADEPGFINDKFQTGVNDDQTLAGRIMGRLQATDSLVIDFMYMYQDAHTDGDWHYDTVDYFGKPLPRFTQANLARTGFPDRMELEELSVRQKLQSGTFTVVLSGTDRYTDLIRDTSQGNALLLGPDDPAAKGVLSIIAEPQSRSLYSVEGRFASSLSGPLQFLIGSYVQWEYQDQGQYIYPTNSAGYIDPSWGIYYGPITFIDLSRTHINEQAIYAQLTWSVTDKLKLTAGVRGFRFDNSFQPNEPIAFGGSPGPGVGGKTTSDQASANGRFNASYSFTEDILTYLQIAQGYRPGGSNDQIGASIEHTVIPAGFRSDKLINYELGYKQAAFGNRLHLTTDVYYIDWKDIQEQLQQPVPGLSNATFPYIGNAGEAHVLGYELETEAKPISPLTLALGAGYTHAYLISADVGAGDGTPGDPLPYVPRFTAYASADYEFHVGLQSRIFVGGDVTWTDSRATDFPENTATYFPLPPNVLTNLRLGLKRGVWTIELLGKNVFNNTRTTDVFSLLPGLTAPGYFPDAPRSIWLQANAAL